MFPAGSLLRRPGSWTSCINIGRQYMTNITRWIWTRSFRYKSLAYTSLTIIQPANSNKALPVFTLRQIFFSKNTAVFLTWHWSCKTFGVTKLTLERAVSFVCAKALSSTHVEAMRAREIFRLFVTAILVTLALGHGMLIDPASRNSAWRFFPNRPSQYTDNELNCGGYSVQWSKNKGKCGVCGDAYHLKNPRYVYPGRYAKDGFIAKTYKEGQEIEVKVKITSNHQGFFRFSLGKVEKRPITQENWSTFCCSPMVLTLGRFTHPQMESSRLSSCFPKAWHVINAWCNGGGQWETTGAVTTKAFAGKDWRRDKKRLWTVQISGSSQQEVQLPQRRSLSLSHLPRRSPSQTHPWWQ